MIRGEHCYIRGAEPDDAPWFFELYDMRRPRAALLDQRREPMLPTVMELRESLARPDLGAGWFYAVEDLEGLLRGFCLLRGANYEVGFTEGGFLPLNEEDFASPLMQEAAAFVRARAFQRLRVGKIMAHCLDSEQRLRQFLLGTGFESDGIQRDAFYGSGCWHGIEAFTLRPGPVDTAEAGAGVSRAGEEELG